MRFIIRVDHGALQIRAVNPVEHQMKHAAGTEHAAHTHLPALRLDQAPGKGQAQAGAGMSLVVTRIQLGEFAEQAGNVALRDPDSAVLHVQPETFRPFGPRPNAHRAARRRELDGIRQVIEQSLFQARRIELQIGHLRIDIDR